MYLVCLFVSCLQDEHYPGPANVAFSLKLGLATLYHREQHLGSVVFYFSLYPVFSFNSRWKM